ncbi:MAG: cell division protein ZapB [Halodesulfovibrio sp.]
MELIDQLEQRIDSLLETIAVLKEDNRRLKEEVDLGLSVLEDENRALKEQLEMERSTQDSVRQRIDALLLKLKDQTGGS